MRDSGKNLINERCNGLSLCIFGPTEDPFVTKHDPKTDNSEYNQEQANEKRLDMRIFQSAKCYLLLQEVTKNDATLIPPRLLDYLVDMTRTYTCTPIGCTTRETTDYLIRELFRRLQTGQVWVALKVFYVFYQLLWRGSRSVIESVRDMDIPFLRIDNVLDRIKLTPQENISGAALPCTLPCATVSHNAAVSQTAPLASSNAFRGSVEYALSRCEATESAFKSIFHPRQDARTETKDIATSTCSDKKSKGAFSCLYCTDEEYISNCVSPEFIYNCLGYIGALCEYCYQHPDVDLPNSRIHPDFTRKAGIAELKVLCEGTLELLQSTATLDLNIPIGCDLAVEMLRKRLSDARVFYSICCYAVVMFLDASISKIMRFLNEYGAELEITQILAPPTNIGRENTRSEENEKEPQKRQPRWGNNCAMGNSTAEGEGFVQTKANSIGASRSVPAASSNHCSFEFMYVRMHNSQVFKEWYNILHQFDRTARMLLNVCETVQGDVSEARALANSMRRIPKDVLERMGTLVRVCREKGGFEKDSEASSSSVIMDPPCSGAAPEPRASPGMTGRGSRNALPGAVPHPASSCSTSWTSGPPSGMYFQDWRDRLSYTQVTWDLQVQSLRKLFPQNSGTTPLFDSIDRKLNSYFNALKQICEQRYNTFSSSNSSIGRETLTRVQVISDSATDRFDSLSLAIWPLEESQQRGKDTPSATGVFLSRRTSDAVHSDPHILSNDIRQDASGREEEPRAASPRFQQQPHQQPSRQPQQEPHLHPHPQAQLQPPLSVAPPTQQRPQPKKQSRELTVKVCSMPLLERAGRVSHRQDRSPVVSSASDAFPHCPPSRAEDSVSRHEISSPLQFSRIYRCHTQVSEGAQTSSTHVGSEPTAVRATAADEAVLDEEADPSTLTEEMIQTNASIESLLEKDDVVVVCNEPFSPDEPGGNMVERFHILREHPAIGEGSYSCVYRAWDESMGRYLAVKEVRLEATRLPSLMRSVLKEYMVLTSLRHPNIVQVVAFMIDGNACNIFMEWVPSGSLQSVLRDNRHRPLRESVVSRYIRDTLLGLEFLHSRGVLHRDIKPGNMLLSTEGVVKLTDFGTSALLAENEQTLRSGVITGTAPYMAPEVVRGFYSAASDVWSLGCAALELATGHVPWEDVDTGARMNPVQLIYMIGKLTENEGHNLPHSQLRTPRHDQQPHEQGGTARASHRPPPTALSKDFLDFLDRIFVLDRHLRAKTSELLNHPFITKHHEVWRLRQAELEATGERVKMTS